MKHYVIGVDFGSLSARSLIVDTQSGEEVAGATMDYPHAVMVDALPSGKTLPRDFALQHPDDYITCLSHVIRTALRESGIRSEEIAGVGIDFTTCTVLPVDDAGEPMCHRAAYADEAHAYVKLWKHHSCEREAEEFTAVARARGETWLAEYGGGVSAEWMFPKILETARCAPSLYRDTARFMEAGDWIVRILTGEETYGAAYAAAKAFWNPLRGGFPSDDYFSAVDERLSGIVGTKLLKNPTPTASCAGRVNERGCALTGIPVGTPVATAMPDGHLIPPAVGACDAGDLCMIAGTSGVQMANGTTPALFHGASGVMYGCIVPDLYTYESGQRCFGDHFDWFIRSCVPAAYEEAAAREGKNMNAYLRALASRLSPGESGLIALDWWNGNRCVLNDATLSGTIVGLTLATRPEEIYRALLEAVSFSTRVILDGYRTMGIDPAYITLAGGIARKDELLMQIFADVLHKEVRVAAATNVPAFGASLYASVAAGIYPDVCEASRALVRPPIRVFRPDAKRGEIYDELYAEYLRLHDYFGRGENPVMHRLREISERAKKQ